MVVLASLISSEIVCSNHTSATKARSRKKATELVIPVTLTAVEKYLVIEINESPFV